MDNHFTWESCGMATVITETVVVEPSKDKFSQCQRCDILTSGNQKDDPQGDAGSTTDQQYPCSPHHDKSLSRYWRTGSGQKKPDEMM